MPKANAVRDSTLLRATKARHAFPNLVLMCRNHHKVIDAPDNLQEFSADRLREIKQAHESAASRSGAPLELSAAAARALRLSGTVYETGSVHMDFRQAEFRIGGEGGAFGGGGGGGGTLTIIGIGRLPPELEVDLNGQDGSAPGGGGGGGGVLQFFGRTVECDDINRGFYISAFLAANAVSLCGLLNVLGGGCSYYPIPCLPQDVRLTFAYIVEFGQILPTSLLHLDLVIIDPFGTEVAAGSLDIEAPSSDDLVRRVPFIQSVHFLAAVYGVWAATLRSGKIVLANLPFEIRQGHS